MEAREVLVEAKAVTGVHLVKEPKEVMELNNQVDTEQAKVPQLVDMVLVAPSLLVATEEPNREVTEVTLAALATRFSTCQ